MGASVFYTTSTGENAQKAFKNAIDDALYESGHGGYTGTIAEKRSFVLIGGAPTTKEAMDLADKLIEDSDPRIDDKWGPAGCIEIASTPKTWLFFGWASS